MYSKGDRVAQSQYGAGTIAEANERQTIVEFDDNGLKAFSTRLVMLVRHRDRAADTEPSFSMEQRPTRTGQARS